MPFDASGKWVPWDNDQYKKPGAVPPASTYVEPEGKVTKVLRAADKLFRPADIAGTRKAFQIPGVSVGDDGSLNVVDAGQAAQFVFNRAMPPGAAGRQLSGTEIVELSRTRSELLQNPDVNAAHQQLYSAANPAPTSEIGKVLLSGGEKAADMALFTPRASFGQGYTQPQTGAGQFASDVLGMTGMVFSPLKGMAPIQAAGTLATGGLATLGKAAQVMSPLASGAALGTSYWGLQQALQPEGYKPGLRALPETAATFGVGEVGAGLAKKYALQAASKLLGRTVSALPPAVEHTASGLGFGVGGTVGAYPFQEQKPTLGQAAEEAGKLGFMGFLMSILGGKGAFRLPQADQVAGPGVRMRQEAPKQIPGRAAEQAQPGAGETPSGGAPREPKFEAADPNFNPATEGYKEFRPGMGIWVRMGADGIQETYFEKVNVGGQQRYKYEVYQEAQGKSKPQQGNFDEGLNYGEQKYETPKYQAPKQEPPKQEPFGTRQTPPRPQEPIAPMGAAKEVPVDDAVMRAAETILQLSGKTKAKVAPAPPVAEAKNDVAEQAERAFGGAVVYDSKGRKWEVLDDTSDPARIKVRSESGAETWLGKKAVSTEPPQVSQEVTAEAVPSETVSPSVNVTTPAEAGAETGEEFVGKQKEPWQMTREEYREKVGSPKHKATYDNYVKAKQKADELEAQGPPDHSSFKGSMDEYINNQRGAGEAYERHLSKEEAREAWDKKMQELQDIATGHGNKIKESFFWGMDAKGKRKYGNMSAEEIYNLLIDKHRKEAVRQALSEGKPVPPEVLADYQELAGKAEESKKEPAPKEQEKGATLKDYGLSIAKGTTKTGKTVWEVTGDTKTYKDYLSKLGARWYGPKKSWSFYTEEDPAAKILAKLPPVEKKEAEPEQKPQKQVATEQPKYGRAGNAVYKKWGTNEYVNADLGDTVSPHTQAFKKFFEFYYNAGLNGIGLNYLNKPDTGEYNFPPFLEDVFFKAGQKDAEAKKGKEETKAPEVDKFFRHGEVLVSSQGHRVLFISYMAHDGKKFVGMDTKGVKGHYEIDLYTKTGETSQFTNAPEKWSEANNAKAEPAPEKSQTIPKEPPSQKPETGVESKQETPHGKVANVVFQKLQAGERFTSDDLFKASDEAYGGTQAAGTYTPKDAYDAMELGVNKYLNENPKSIGPSVSADKAKQILDEIQSEILEKIPTQTKRTAEQDEFQQFSTPPNLAYVVAWTANVHPKEVVLEPSAGIGGLAVFPHNAGAKVVVNELSSRRAKILREMGFDQIFTEDAEQIDNILPDSVKPTVVIMNPPFSATAGRMEGVRKTKFAETHIEQALNRLEPGGRLVAIVGRGMSDDAATFKAWWKKIKQECNVRANVGIDGSNYKKYGTSFDVQLLVVDKTGATPEGGTMTGSFTQLEDVLPLLEVVKNDRTVNRPTKQTTPEHNEQGASQESGGKAGPRPPVSVPTAEVGTGEREVGISGRKQQQRERGSADSGGEVTGAKPGESVKLPDEGRPGGRGSVDTATTSGKAEGTSGSGGVSDRQAESGTNRKRGTGTETGIKVESQEAKATGEELSDAVFTAYAPQKLKIPGAKQHPGHLAQSAAMAAVEPPTPTYTPNLPKEVIKEGKLSIAQLESIVYAGQAHQQTLPSGQRRGFFIGDGTGVGKGREISGIVLDNMRQGRKKAVWISKNNPLFVDAKRDFGDIGGNDDLIFELGKIKQGTPVKQGEGILFTTYNTLSQNLEVSRDGELSIKKDRKARIDQVVDWLGKDFDGVIAFDEAHHMQNSLAMKGKRGMTKPSAMALAGIELQNRLPDARIVYVSATGATEVANLAYGDRLGLWGEGTPFADKRDFVGKIQTGGLAAMELVARDMKAMGAYIARNLSFEGVTYGTIQHDLTPEQLEVYDTMAEGWQVVLQNLNEALEETRQKQNGNAKSNAMSRFWGAQQRFFNQVLTSSQMPSVVEQVKKDIEDGKAVVMQLVSTNEAAQNRQIAKMEEGDSLEDLALTPRDMLMQYIEKSFPTQQYEEYTDDNGNVRTRPVVDSRGNPVQNRKAVHMKEQLLDKLGSMRVPEGPLEIILNTFGAGNVAEITGRSRRIVKVPDESGRMKAVRETRTPKHAEADARAFMDDKKNILVFSDAGGTGRSYHASLTAKNQRHRIHYLIQPGWRADNAVQGFGRTHRTNQANAPHYVLVTTDLKGQKRFISSIARRLDQLGALTKGQRQTGSQGLFSAKDNLESSYAKDALQRFYEDLVKGQVPTFEPRELLQKMGLDKMLDEQANLKEAPELRDIAKFLNRLLALESDLQNKVFDAFSDRLDVIVERAAANGTLDVGLENFKADKVSVVDEKTVYTDDNSGAETKYVELDAAHRNTPVAFGEAAKLSRFVGFYKNTRSNRIYAARQRGTRTLQNGSVVYVYELHGQSKDNVNPIDKPRLDEGNWEKVEGKEAASLWKEALDKLPEYRHQKVHLITGAVLPIWDRLGSDQVRVIRVKTEDGKVLLGRIIPERIIDSVLKNLNAQRTKEEMPPGEIVDRVLEDGYTVHLANGWKIVRKRVSGEYRIEIIGKDLYQHTPQLEKEGVFRERIQFETRYFIPSGDDAVDVFSRVTKYRPVAEVVSPATGRSSAVSGDYREHHNQSWFGEQEAKARDRITSRKGRLFSGPPLDDLIDYAIIGAVKIAKGTTEFAKWSAEMAKEFGSDIEQYLKKIWESSKKIAERIKRPFSTPQQEITSADTSINSSKVPATFNKVEFRPGTLNADIGGGKFDNATEFLAQKGVSNIIYDPFNRTEEWNEKAILRMINGQCDTATVNNVLNVIKEPENRADVIANAAEAIKPDGVSYFLTYEGDASGVGKETSRGWQENRKTKDYVEEVNKFFDEVTIKNNVIEARKPVKILSRLNEETDAARERIASRKGRLMSGIPADDIADYAIIGASKLAKGFEKFSEWSKEMLKDLGDAVKKYMGKIFHEAKQFYARYLEGEEGFARIDVFDRAAEILKDKLGIKEKDIQYKAKPVDRWPGLWSYLQSPGRLAVKHRVIAPYVDMAKKCMDMQESLRDIFNRRMEETYTALAGGKTRLQDPFRSKRESFKKNKEAWMEILLTGDLEGRKYSPAELRQLFGANEAVVRAYRLTRSAMDHAYNIANKQRMNRGKAEINYRKGYIPHFFHDYFVVVNGEIAFSARTLAEAIRLANPIARVQGNKVKILPKQFEFEGGDVQAAVIGDMNYFKMKSKIAKDFGVSLEDAQGLMDGIAKMKNRSRFVGNFMERKGAKGYEQDLDWVLRHYFNMVGRYAALDAFKSKAITRFERQFGRFDSEQKYSGAAKYIKEYIEDINGNPSHVEDILNRAIENTPAISKFFGGFTGARPSLKLANMATNAVAIAKLGLFNASAALVNLTQLSATNAVIGEKWTAIGLGKAAAVSATLGRRTLGMSAPASRDIGILKKMGVDVQLGFETGSGYSKAGQLGLLFKGSTYLFQRIETLNRRTSGLGAYYKAISEGKTPEEAIKYAKKVVDTTQFDYSVADAPNLFRRAGPPGQILLQFKKYPIKMLELAGPFGGQLDAIGKVRFWTTMAILSGVYAIPGIETIKNFVNWLTGDDLELATKKYLMEWASSDKDKQAVAKTILYGAFSNAGIDISKRVGLGDFFPSQASDLTGPTISTVLRAMQMAARGNFTETVRAISPAVGNMLIAASGDEITSPTQRDRLKAKLDPTSRFVKALGFTTMAETLQTDVSRIITNSESKQKDKEAAAIDEFIKAAQSNDAKRYNNAVDKLSEYGISSKRVTTEMQKKGMLPAERAEELVPKKRQSEYEGLAEFD
jgi:predicted RNA methylase